LRVLESEGQVSDVHADDSARAAVTEDAAVCEACLRELPDPNDPVTFREDVEKLNPGVAVLELSVTEHRIDPWLDWLLSKTPKAHAQTDSKSPEPTPLIQGGV